MVISTITQETHKCYRRLKTIVSPTSGNMFSRQTPEKTGSRHVQSRGYRLDGKVKLTSQQRRREQHHLTGILKQRFSRCASCRGYPEVSRGQTPWSMTQRLHSSGLGNNGQIIGFTAPVSGTTVNMCVEWNEEHLLHFLQ